MDYEILKCPDCGAKLPPPATSNAILVCEYCGGMLAANASAAWPRPLRPVDERPFDPHRPRVTVAGVSYALLGRLGRGDGSDVFFARRDARITELAVMKVARSLVDNDLVSREFDVVAGLRNSKAHGADHFTRLLPQNVSRGPVDAGDGKSRTAAVYRWRPGFSHTLAAVREAYPRGVDPRAAVWMWKRALELLGFVHRAGYTHGAMLPPHWLVHPRDHGVVFAGWSCATRLDARAALPAWSIAHEAFYPRDVWQGAPATAATDMAMSARCVAFALGGDPATGRVPDAVPTIFAGLVRAQCDPATALDDAWALKEKLDAAAHASFGPSRYVPFAMP